MFADKKGRLETRPLIIVYAPSQLEGLDDPDEQARDPAQHECPPEQEASVPWRRRSCARYLRLLRQCSICIFSDGANELRADRRQSSLIKARGILVIVILDLNHENGR
jgi:hypothetical protein